MTASAHRLLYAGVAVILLATAYLSGIATSKGGLANVVGGGSYKDGYAAGFADAKEKVAAAGILPFAGPVTSLNGTITAIDGDRITVDVAQTIHDPLSEPAPTTRTVTLSSDTIVELQEEKDPDTLSKEIAAFVRRGDAPPAPFTSTALEATDLAVGDMIIVTAAGNVDIAYATDVQAARITKLSGTDIPVPPPPPLPLPPAPTGTEE